MKTIQNWLLIGMGLLLFIGPLAFCNFGYGKIRTSIPSQIRTAAGGDREREAKEYFRDVLQAFEKLVVEREKCKKTLDQICLTKAYKEMLDEVGDWVPATAGHMVPHHQRLKSALDEMYELHLRAEKGASPASLEKDIRIRYEELLSALEEWVTQGRK